jgi:hypothetical protein
MNVSLVIRGWVIFEIENDVHVHDVLDVGQTANDLSDGVNESLPWMFLRSRLASSGLLNAFATLEFDISY